MNARVKSLALALALAPALVLAPAPLSAQDAAPPPTAVDAAILDVATRLFDAMRARDTAAIRSAFTSDARLVTTGTRDGQPFHGVETIDGFVAIIAGAPAGLLLDERIFHPEVRLDDNLAQLWLEYDFWTGDTFSHCGVDALQLVRTTDGWKISQLADTRRQQGCPDREP